MAGFYSKDLIIEIRIFNRLNSLIFFILIVATGLTLTYSARFIFYTVFSNRNSSPLSYNSRLDKNIN
jgi:NADH:ubiquinone oxidoreductase subunit 5 (subunit L)/multisubunit Na+/H+ antiporter MnhA subunit